jgi:hypothetical protein
MKSKGYQIIQDGTIYDAQISATAGIVESKLLLDFSTAGLFGDMVSLTRSTSMQSGIFLTFPATGFKIVDAVTGQTFQFTCNSGVLTATPI